MQLLYALAIAIFLVLVLRAAQWFRDYQRRLRLKLEPVPPGPDPDIMPNPELGKVRVVPRFDGGLHETPEAVPAVADEPPPAMAPADPAPADPVPVHREESVPLLLTPVASDNPQPEVEQHDMFADEPIAPPPLKKNESLPAGSRASVLYDKPVIEPVRPVVAAEEKPHLDVEDVIAFHVVCRVHPFNGEDLLRCVLSYGLRYGEMSIFHRHEQPTGQGRVLFSMAKAVEPGTFDLEAMTGEEVPGVSFFLGLPGVSSITAYDIMVDTAKRLATELQGDILDQQQQPLTRQLVEHYRERVQEFERRRLMNRPAH